MNPDYQKKAVGVRTPSAEKQHERFKKQIDPTTRKMTTGMTDGELGTQLVGAEADGLKRGTNTGRVQYKKPNAGLSTRLSGAVNKIMGRLGSPISNMLLDPKGANVNEDYILEAWKEQQKISEGAREKLVGPPHFQSLLLHERIQDENAKQDILNFSRTGSAFHINHYDTLFGQDGIMFKNPNDLTEEETRYGLGYTNSVAHLFKLKNKKEAYKIASDLIQYNKEFVTWWAYGDQESQVTDSVVVNGTERTFPKIVHHGTFGDIFPSVGFWNRHMGSDPGVLQRLKGYSVENEQEVSSHLGSAQQAVGATADKRSGGRRTKYTKGEDFHKIRDNPKEIQSTIVNRQEGDLRGSGAKFYSGFIKANKLLKLPELYNWEFDVILEYLQGGTDGKGKAYGGKDLDTGKTFFEDGWTYDKPDTLSGTRDIKLNPNVITHPKIIEFKNNATKFPRLMEYIGKGTAVEQIMNHAYKMMQEDYARENIEEKDWNKSFEKMTPEEKGEIHYYKMHGLIKFINDDLDYDAVEYDNQVEDVLTKGGNKKPKSRRDPSYILFHPWQFKSIYNHGEFSRDRRNFLGSNSKYTKKEQVA
jgi:hypothetical protein